MIPECFPICGITLFTHCCGNTPTDREHKICVYCVVSTYQSTTYQSTNTSESDCTNFTFGNAYTCMTLDDINYIITL